MRNSKMILKIYRRNTIKNIKEKIIKAGMLDKFDPLDFLNVRFITTLIIFFAILILSDKGFILAPVISLLYFYAYEYVLVDLKINKRKKSLENEAIYFFEVLALTLESGRNLKASLEITTKNIDSDISNEFKRTLEEVDLGKSLVESLEDMKKRIPSDTINNTILNITQSNIFGNSIIESLYNQIDFLREQQILDIKAQIAKLPTKISVISVLFFLPIMMLIILAPVVLDYFLGG
ncbi:MAG: type II secretion system F family protein [Bacilli bacterium]|nr:type II secretion system F family protein [Bacilli bacterium]